MFPTQSTPTRFPQSVNSVDHCYYARKAIKQPIGNILQCPVLLHLWQCPVLPTYCPSLLSSPTAAGNGRKSADFTGKSGEQISHKSDSRSRHKLELDMEENWGERWEGKCWGICKLMSDWRLLAGSGQPMKELWEWPGKEWLSAVWSTFIRNQPRELSLDWLRTGLRLPWLYVYYKCSGSTKSIKWR